MKTPFLFIFFSGPIFLLIFLAAGEVGNIQAGPVDFVCDDHARRDMNALKKLEAAMVKKTKQELINAV